MKTQDHVHQAGRLIARPRDEVFAFMADAQKLGQWSLGCFETRQVQGELYRGTSLFDGSQTYVRIEALPELGLLRYWVGGPERQEPRISATVLAHDGESCILSMTAVRTAGMSDARWERLQRCHEAELDLIQTQLESGFVREEERKRDQ